MRLPGQRYPEIDKLITQGESLGSILRVVSGITTRQGISSYIDSTDQYAIWKQKREERKNAEKVAKINLHTQRYNQRQRLLTLLTTYLFQQMENSRWADQKTVQYILQRANINPTTPKIPPENLVRLFEAYQRAKEQGERLSLKELSESSGISFTYVGKILRKVGLELFYDTKKHKPTPDWKRDAIRRVPISGLTPKDAAYFLDLPEYVVSDTLKRIGCNYVPDTLSNRLTYKSASYVYEASDLGFTNGEIASLLNMRPETVSYVLTHRSEISERIIGKLQLLFATDRSGIINKYTFLAEPINHH